MLCVRGQLVSLQVKENAESCGASLESIKDAIVKCLKVRTEEGLPFSVETRSLQSLLNRRSLTAKFV